MTAFSPFSDFAELSAHYSRLEAALESPSANDEDRIVAARTHEVTQDLRERRSIDVDGHTRRLQRLSPRRSSGERCERRDPCGPYVTGGEGWIGIGAIKPLDSFQCGVVPIPRWNVIHCLDQAAEGCLVPWSDRGSGRFVFIPPERLPGLGCVRKQYCSHSFPAPLSAARFDGVNTVLADLKPGRDAWRFIWPRS